MSYADIISSIGVTLILGAFVLSTFKLIKSNGIIYFLMNITGGLLACYGSILIHSVPFAILEGMWACVAIAGVFRTISNPAKHV